jgi:hypothetical protein
MSDFESSKLVEAILVWTGWGCSAMPRRDSSLLSNHFGNEMAAKLFPLIKSLEDDFYSSDARFVAANLQEMGILATEDFKRKHPTIADEIVKALAWCYTFDFK